MSALVANVEDVAVLELGQRISNGTNQRQQILHSVGACNDHKHGKWQCGEIMFALEFPIHRKEGVDLAACTSQQITVLETCPTQSLNSVYVMIRQTGDQVVRQVFVKQNAHW
jgi:hypothetical protein